MKVGDGVRLLVESFGACFKVGSLGTVVGLVNEFPDLVYVKFDEENDSADPWIVYCKFLEIVNSEI